MYILSEEKRIAVVAALVEGNSIRSTCRLTGVAKGTVGRLLQSLGAACLDYQQRTLVNLPCKRVQCDEVWAFVGCKEKNVTPGKKAQGQGDAWTWTALCSETKLLLAWQVGQRDVDCATGFMKDVAGRLASRVQLTTDGFKAYLVAVESAFGVAIDFSQLVKVYGTTDTDSRKQYLGADRRTISGWPHRKHISTSHIERSNLTLRMTNRRLTRKTNAFSKRVDMLRHSIALTFMHYNFCRIHQTLRVTPAMEAGISDHVWEIADIIGLIREQSRLECAA